MAHHSRTANTIAPFAASLRPHICQSCSRHLSRSSHRYITNAVPNTRGQESIQSTSRSSSRAEDAPAIARSQPTWHDLQWVGSRKFIWENTKPVKEVHRWGPGQAIPLDKLESQLLCTLMETLLLFDGQHVSKIDMSKLPIRTETEFNELFPDGISVNLNAHGQPQLDISTAERHAILGTSTADIDCSTMQSHQQPVDGGPSNGETTNKPISSWRAVPLQPLSLKFAFLKRLFQRTGHRISDSNLSACRTVRSVQSMLIAQHAEKRKLAQELQQDDHGFGLKDRANVQLKTRRYTRVDRDRALGRWKLTREALEKAGLPEFWKDLPLSRRRRLTAALPAQQSSQSALMAEDSL